MRSSERRRPGRLSTLGRHAAAGVLALLLVAGCVLTGTKVFTHSLGDIVIQGAFFAAATADLSDNATYADHERDIESVDEIGFTTRIVNGTIAEAGVSIFFSEDPDLSSFIDVRNRALPLLEDLVVPAQGERTITYEESIERLENFATLQTLIEKGSVTIYALSDGFFNLTLEDFTLVVTFTVGL